ncbi:hypothetical protein JQX13_50460 [Archangium violaceum]|nr:hypothetical protein JQX13_50460 [Archangium violaceum]
MPYPRRIALVGCGKSKLEQPAPARELYTGPLFRAALDVAQAEFGADVWILSAKHGLVDLDEDVAPYELALGDLTSEAQEAWARDVIRNLRDDDDGSPAHLTVYAGSAYVEALRAHLPSTWTLDDPMKGLSQGGRLAWLSARRAALSANPAAARSAASLPSAGPSGPAPVEHSMIATANRLTDEQRQEAFARALETERALKELPELRARLLAALEKQEAGWRAEHTRLMHAAITGESAEGAQQPELPLAAHALAALVQAPAAVASPDKHAPSEPPKGKRRTRSRKEPAAETGEKRVESAESARTAMESPATASQVTAEDDLVPAPRVPCCTCTHSIADHKLGKGRCERCKCRKFKPTAVATPEQSSTADSTPCECDGCGKTFKASELAPLGPEDARGYYCAGCKAEVEEMDDDAPATPAPEPSDSSAQVDAAPPEPPAEPKRARSRAKSKARSLPAEPAQAELLPVAQPVAAEPGTWRVELPERCEGRIVLLWLVNESTGERRAASWWGGTSSLKCGHHLAGKLEGAALAAHLELDAWWKANLESVVAPLEQACRDGKVPGLKVYEPEPSADGPYRYALSNGWVLEVWDTGEARVAAYFVGPTERADTQWRSGPFHLNGELLVAGAVADISWSADNEEVVREAEDLIARGFVAELRKAASR